MDIKEKISLWLAGTFLVMALIMFAAAGTLAWPAGWAYLLLFACYSVAETLWLLKHNPGLIEERIGFRPDQGADKLFAATIYALFVIWLAVMPLDAVRYPGHPMPVWLRAAGAIILLLAFFIYHLTFRENPYLSTAVRIQKERGHKVISTGPYRFVRHPMYAGGFLYFLGTPLFLGSWIGLIFFPVFAAMIAVRAVFEERFLRERLEGYDAYMEKVKYRFIPRIW